MGKLSPNEVKIRSSQKGLSCRILKQSLRSWAGSLVRQARVSPKEGKDLVASDILVTSERYKCSFPWKDKMLVLPRCHSLLLLRGVHGGNEKGDLWHWRGKIYLLQSYTQCCSSLQCLRNRCLDWSLTRLQLEIVHESWWRGFCVMFLEQCYFNYHSNDLLALASPSFWSWPGLGLIVTRAI